MKWLIRSGTIRSYGLVGVGLTFLDEVCYRGALRIQKLNPSPVILCLLLSSSADPDVALLSTYLAIYLPACHHATMLSAMSIME